MNLLKDTLLMALIVLLRLIGGLMVMAVISVWVFVAWLICHILHWMYVSHGFALALLVFLVVAYCVGWWIDRGCY